jgi:hypothetical protein
VTGQLLEMALELAHELVLAFAPFAPRIRVWLADAARPTHGLELRGGDGSRLTGLVVVDHSRVVFVLAARHEGPSAEPPFTGHLPLRRTYPSDDPFEDDAYPYP